LTWDFCSAQRMEDGVRARVERYKISRLLMALATTIPGMKLHKNGCLRHQTRTLPPHLTSPSSGDGLSMLLRVVRRQSPSLRNERPTVSAQHVNFIQLNEKV